MRNDEKRTDTRIIHPQPRKHPAGIQSGPWIDCFSVHDDKAQPFHNHRDGSKNQSLYDAWNKYIENKEKLSYNLTVHCNTTNSVPTVEYVLRAVTSETIITTSNTSKNDFYLYAKADRFTNTKGIVRTGVQITPIIKKDKFTATMKNGKIIEQSDVNLITVGVQTIGPGIRAVRFNGREETIPDEQEVLVEGVGLTFTDFLAHISKLGLDPMSLADTEDLAIKDLEAQVIVYIVKDDQEVTLSDGTIVPSLKWVDESLNRDKNVPWKLEEDGRIYAPTISPYLFSNYEEYKKLTYTQFCDDNVEPTQKSKADVKPNMRGSEELPIASIDVKISQGKVATDRHNHSSWYSDVCEACGTNKGTHLAGIVGAACVFAPKVLGEGTMVWVDNKSSVSLKVSAAYLNGEIVKEPMRMFVNNSRVDAELEGSQTRKMNVHIAPQNLKKLMQTRSTNKIVDTLLTRGVIKNYSRGVSEEAISINGIPYSNLINARSTDVVDEAPSVLTEADFNSPSMAASLNNLWTTFIASLSFMTGSQDEFRKMIKRVNKYNKSWRKYGTAKITKVINKHESDLKQLFSEELSLYDKADRLIKDEDLMDGYAACLSMMSYFVSAVAFFKLTLEADYAMMTYDSVISTLPYNMYEGAVQQLHDSFVDNKVANALADFFKIMMTEYIEFEGWKFFKNGNAPKDYGESGSTLATEPLLADKVLDGIGKGVAVIFSAFATVFSALASLVRFAIFGAWGDYRNMYERVAKSTKDRFLLPAIDVEAGVGADVKNDNTLTWTTYTSLYHFLKPDASSYLTDNAYEWSDNVPRNNAMFKNDMQARNVLIAWWIATSPNDRAAAEEFLKVKPLATAKAIMAFICQSHTDAFYTNGGSTPSITDVRDKALAVIDSLVYDNQKLSLINDTWCQTHFGRYRMVYSNFVPEVVKDPNLTAEVGKDVTKHIGFKYSYDIGFTAHPKYIENYSRWLSVKNFEAMIDDQWNYAERMKDLVFSYTEDLTDSLRSAYYDNLSSYLWTCFLPSVLNRDTGIKVTVSGDAATDCIVNDIDEAEVASFMNDDLADEIIGMSDTLTFHSTIRRNTSFANSMVNAFNYQSPNQRWLGTFIKGAKAALKVVGGIATALISGISMACTFANAKREKANAIATMNAKFLTKMQDIKKSYDIVANALNDGTLVATLDFEPLRTPSIQIYKYIDKTLNTVETMKVVGASAGILAGAALVTSGAMQLSAMDKTRKVTVNGDKLPSKQTKKAMEEEKKLANEAKTNQAALADLTERRNKSNQQLAEFEQTSSGRLNDLLNKPSLQPHEESELLALQHRKNQLWEQNKNLNYGVAQATETEAEARAKHEKFTSTKQGKKAQKYNNGGSDTVTPLYMDEKDEALNPDMNFDFAEAQDKLSKATFKAISEVSDSQTDVFGQLLDSRLEIAKVQENLEQIKKAVRNIGTTNTNTNPLPRIRYN